MRWRPKGSCNLTAPRVGTAATEAEMNISTSLSTHFTQRPRIPPSTSRTPSLCTSAIPQSSPCMARPPLDNLVLLSAHSLAPLTPAATCTAPTLCTPVSTSTSWTSAGSSIDKHVLHTALPRGLVEDRWLRGPGCFSISGLRSAGCAAIGNVGVGPVVEGNSRITLYDSSSKYLLDDGVQFSLIDELLSRRCKKGHMLRDSIATKKKCMGCRVLTHRRLPVQTCFICDLEICLQCVEHVPTT